jgi:rhamnose utilization protein RhaD (predicted bifunctional aldolase and dehydrogenase)/NAD(P)-dependent dehydrogenase (short-subunit alcohol dehydrogenase family)
MQSLWNADQATLFTGELGLRVYTSRLLGREKFLVLHGGGNTSVKLKQRNLFGEEEEILYVKGSGWDLETIEEAGFAPVRLDHARRLAGLESLSDPQMVNELKTHMTEASAPAPSIETLLHGCLPYKYVDHTHADAVLTVTNTEDGAKRIRKIYGDSVVIIPYVMPGFDLAKVCAKRFAEEAGRHTIGMVLLNHGIFSFGDTAQQSYERMIQLVTLAEDYLRAQSAWELPEPSPAPDIAPSRVEIASLRRKWSEAAGFPMILKTCRDSRCLAFARRADVQVVSQHGPATPDHVLRTKRVPMLGHDPAAFVKAYKAYFERHAGQTRERKTMLDPAPRVALDPEWGLIAAGRSAHDAQAAEEIYRHTMDVIERAERLGGYRALSERELFEVEYWDLEQAKLKKSGNTPVFAGEAAIVTGAASGIGKACVQALLKRGAAVAGFDVNAEIGACISSLAFLGLRCDVTAKQNVEAALDDCVKAFGGLDMLILNAGIFPASRDLASLPDEEWERVMQVNLDANLLLMRECYPLLELSPNGGRVVVIGSKNVVAPGSGAAAYSASKAALTQLARIAALEWGQERIRVNVIHPDAVFDTGIWTDQVLASRAARYGLTIEQYKRRNILRVEISSRDVAELAAELCGPLFAKTTGAQLPVDGGNERVI